MTFIDTGLKDIKTLQEVEKALRKGIVEASAHKPDQVLLNYKQLSSIESLFASNGNNDLFLGVPVIVTDEVRSMQLGYINPLPVKATITAENVHQKEDIAVSKDYSESKRKIEL